MAASFKELDATTALADQVRVDEGSVVQISVFTVVPEDEGALLTAWESVAAFRAAVTSPEFQNRIGQHSNGAVASPHLFKKLAVANHCVA